MSKLKPYDSYQPVQYDYVAELPEEWQLLPNLAIFQERKETGGEELDYLSVSAIKGIVKMSDYEDRKDRTSEDKSNYLVVHNEDIPYNTMLMWAGAVGRSEYHGIVSPAYTVLKAKHGVEINSKYFHYMFRSPFYRDYAKRFSYGIVDSRLRLYYTYFKRMYSIVPPLETQNAIAAYLDRKTQQIQSFIQKKERLIELLEEEMHAKISKVITKGVEKAPLSNSKSEWTGPIPEHWTFLPLGYVLSYISYGFTNPMPTTDNGPFMLTANDIGDGEIHFATCRRTSEIDFTRKLSAKSIPIHGDILVTKDGTLGRTSLFHGENTCINQSVALLRVNPQKASNAFIENLLRSKCYLGKMIYDAEGTTIKHIYITKLTKMKIGLPPLDEQLAINDKIEIIRNESNSLIKKIQIELEKSKEYKAGLITQVVTGQLKVPTLNHERVMH